MTIWISGSPPETAFQSKKRSATAWMDPGDNLYDAKVEVLSEQIEHHVGEEEGEMFPEVRKGKVDLVVLGSRMEAFKSKLAPEAQ